MPPPHVVALARAVDHGTHGATALVDGWLVRLEDEPELEPGVPARGPEHVHDLLGFGAVVAQRVDEASDDP